MSAATTITSAVDRMWISHVTGADEGFVDVFYQSYSGYWLRGVAHDPKRGWLAYEFGSGDTYSEDEAAEAINAWESGNPIPELWHRLDRDAAVRAWAEGVKRHGERWFSDGDGPRYDAVLQHGLGSRTSSAGRSTFATSETAGRLVIVAGT